MDRRDVTNRENRTASPHRLPWHAPVGVAIVLVSEIGLALRLEPFWTWHTPIAWTGYILVVDGLTFTLRGDSWLIGSPREFVFLATASIPLWLVFEFYNLFIDNWHYVNLPDPWWLRSLGYAWAFATIWPAIFETGDLVAAVRRRSPRRSEGLDDPPRIGFPVLASCMLAGLVMLAWPLLEPSPYLAAPVWLGFTCLLDPINARLGGGSVIADALRGRYDRLLNLCTAGLICGVLWEFWNYWARAKWIYTVPIFPELKLFEMPLAGYAGFPVFAVECFAMYVALRRLLWRGRCRSISL